MGTNFSEAERAERSESSFEVVFSRTRGHGTARTVELLASPDPDPTFASGQECISLINPAVKHRKQLPGLTDRSTASFKSEWVENSSGCMFHTSCITDQLCRRCDERGTRVSGRDT